MSKFNFNTRTSSSAPTYEGGHGKKKSLLEDWTNMLFSSFLSDQFYESAEEQQERFVELTQSMIHEYGIEFVMKATVFARQELGMRSVSHLAAAVVNDYQAECKRSFYKQVCNRPDDIAEIFAAIDMLGCKRSHALVRGCADYLSSCSEYQIGKYKMNGKAYNMFDIINITHAHSDAISAYKNGTLELPDTWEVSISSAVDEAERNENWIRLVEERKLGYLALIRNLNNIVNAVCGYFSNDLSEMNAFIGNELVPQITNSEAIRKSKVFPYQIYVVYKNIKVRNNVIDNALDQAFSTAIGNMPKLEGSNCIVIDVSGSMTGSSPATNNRSILEVCAVYAACVFLACDDCDIIKFATYAGKMDISKLNSAFSIIEAIISDKDSDQYGYSTNFDEAIKLIHDNDYTRIFLFSDQQCCCSNLYDQCDSVDSFICNGKFDYFYSFDLGNYPVQCIPNSNKVKYITALNDKVFDFIRINELGESLKDYIESSAIL